MVIAPDLIRVVDRCDECRDPIARPLHRERLAAVVVHRTIWEPADAVGACRRFQDPADLGPYTGGENPYHFLIQPDAQIIQAIAMNERGSHARRFNSSALAVALMHPCERSPLPHEMGIALVRLLRLLCLYVGGVRGRLWGHDELPGASRDPSKECPGINMHEIRALIADSLRGWLSLAGTEQADHLLEDAGIRLRTRE